MKNVLYLEYFFPPLISHGRAVGFCRYLPNAGWTPMVISAGEDVRYGKDYSALSALPEGLKVFRVAHKEPTRITRAIKRKLRIDADFPDYYKGWFKPAYLKASSVIQRQKIDLIWSASPTFATALVAMKLKNKFRIPWVAQLVDGWAVNDHLRNEWERNLVQPFRWFHESRVRKAEKKVLESADRTVTVCDHVKQRLIELHEVTQRRIEVLSNGYDESAFQGLAASRLFPDRLTITFLGSWNYTHFTEPIRAFLDIVKEIDNHVEVCFVGRAANPVQDMHKDNATCVLHVSMSKALSFGLGSDFLLVVLPNFAKWIPAKIFDYLRIGKPIIALVPDDGDAAKLVREARGGFVISYDLNTMKKQLQGIFEASKRGDFRNFHPDQEYVSQFEWRNVTKRMARIFDEVAR